MRLANALAIVSFVILAVKGINSENDADVYQKYIEMDKNLKAVVKSVVKSALPYIVEAGEHLNVSSKCTREMFKLVSEIQKLKLPAISFLDAIGKLPEGILLGRFAFLGDYEECVSATVTERNGEVAFRGQYCVISVKPLLPKITKSQTVYKVNEQLLNATRNVSEFMRFLLRHLQLLYFGDVELGICVPTGCSIEDLQEILTYIDDRFSTSTNVEYCDFERKNDVFTPRMTLAVCILSLLGLLVLIGTFIDYCSKGSIIKGVGARLLVSFSILTNFPKLVNTKSSAHTLSCLFGVRSLSLFYVILLHQYGIENILGMIAHRLRSLDALQTFFFNVLSNGLLVVDVFFFVGGLLNCYIRVKMNANSKTPERSLLIFVHRLWRFYPPLILVTFVLPNIFGQGYGPRREVVRENFNNCERNWWQNLLFINNFFDQENTACMPQTWYVAADMQLFIISLFTVPIFFRNPKKGVIFHSIIVFAGTAASFAWAWYKNVSPALSYIRPLDEEIQKYRNAYSATQTHIAPYFIGLLAGFYLSMNEGLKIPKVLQAVGWPVAGLLYVSMLFLPMYWNLGAEHTVFGSALYFSTSRVLFILGVAWMVICCATGHGGIINYILSLKIWIPIARLSFMAYLISPAIQAFYGANLRVMSHYHNTVHIWHHFGDIVASLLLSLVLVLLAESPFIAMEKVIFGARTSDAKSADVVMGNGKPVSVNNIEMVLAPRHLNEDGTRLQTA